MRPTLALLALATLAACTDPGPPATPPEGWETAGDTRWFVPGTDTTTAFRDLTTLEAMGVARDDSELVRWAQEKMTDVYRTAPETVDSVFAADLLPVLQAGVPAGESYEETATDLVNTFKRDLFQRYNATRYSQPAEPFAIPAELQDTSGRIAVQVYVDTEQQPVAVKLVEGTGTALDQMFMRRAIESTYSPAWVRETAGRSAGTEIYNWAHVSSDFAR